MYRTRDMDVVHINPKSLFPTNLSSSTIFGAICVAIKEVYGADELERMLDLFDGENNPFILSSAFPFVNGSDEKRHYFFPKLIVEPFREPITDYWNQAKRFKSVRWIHQAIFDDWINGRVSELAIIKGLDERYRVKSGMLFPKHLDLEPKLMVAEVAHNQLNRLSTRSENFFYSTGTYFRDMGFFFLIDFFDDSYEKKVVSALRFIEDRGFGGDISSGQGQFEIGAIERGWSIKEPADADAFTTLALYSPRDSEFNSFDKERLWYELIKVQGRSSDGVIRKAMYMFKEGSTFSISEPIGKRRFYGKLEEVRQEPKRAVEYAIAFPVKMRVQRG